MRIAFAIFRYFPFGGLQRDMMSIAQEAQARGHQVTIFCGEWSGDKPKKINVVVVDSKLLFDRSGVKSFVQGFEKVFQRNNFDVLIGFNKMPGLDVYFAGDSCFAQKAYEERSCFYRLTSRARLYLNYEKAIFRDESKTHIFSIAESERKHFARYYATAPERFHLLSPGISQTQFRCDHPQTVRKKLRAEWGGDENTQIIVCIGSGFKTKGLDRSIAAFAELQKSSTNPSLLVVVGADNPKHYVQQAHELSVSNQVIFLGGRKDIADILQATDVLLHPAYRELAGNVILEAMLAGTPVVTTDVCGFAHYVSEQQMGAVIKAPYEQRQCVKALVDILCTDKSIWEARGQQFALTADVFSRQARAVDVLESLISHSQRPTSELIVDTAQHKIILRDEFIAQWSGKDVFALVQNLSGPVARELADRQTLRFELNGKGYYRKLHRGVGWKEIIKNLLQLRLPVLGAKNEWLALNKLRSLGVTSLEPVAYGEQKTNPATQKSFIVTRELTGVVQLDHYFQKNKVTRREKIMLLEMVANMAREIHLAGINHRDFYLCHFMLDIASIAQWRKDGIKPRLHIVDLHRAQIRRQVPLRWLIKDLGGLYFSSLDLGFTRNDYLRFLRTYWQSPLRAIFLQHAALLHAIASRAIKTYKRDFGVMPALPLTSLKG